MLHLAPMVFFLCVMSTTSPFLELRRFFFFFFSFYLGGWLWTCLYRYPAAEWTALWARIRQYQAGVALWFCYTRAFSHQILRWSTWWAEAQHQDCWWKGCFSYPGIWFGMALGLISLIFPLIKWNSTCYCYDVWLFCRFSHNRTKIFHCFLNTLM